MTAFVGADLSATYTAAQLSGGEAGKVPGIGDIYVTHDNKTYRFGRYLGGAGAIAAVAGNMAYIYAPGGVSTGVFNDFTSDLSDSAEIGAGMLCAAIPSGDYGWIQVKGLATLNTALTAGGDGDPLTPTGSTDGTLDVVAAFTDPVCAYAVDASAKIVVLNCPY